MLTLTSGYYLERYFGDEWMHTYVQTDFNLTHPGGTTAHAIPNVKLCMHTKCKSDRSKGLSGQSTTFVVVFWPDTNIRRGVVI